LGLGGGSGGTLLTISCWLSSRKYRSGALFSAVFGFWGLILLSSGIVFSPAEKSKSVACCGSLN